MLIGLTACAAHADWASDIGYTRLQARLGALLPQGAGISVSHVEPSVSEETAAYAASSEASPAGGNFAGKTFVFVSGPSDVSWHAAAVGETFYGVNGASAAPLAGTGGAHIRAVEANDWLGSASLHANLSSNTLPETEPHPVANHSWIGLVPTHLQAAEANDTLRRLDFQIQRDDYVAMAGVNNGAETAVPELLASSYNALSVGLTNGSHSTGATSGNVDGSGRVKPEIVAPLARTSYATGLASSCAALLAGAAADTPALNAAQHSEVIRALLLAGARKTPFPAWANTTTRPLDPHFGAGEINIWRSFQSLSAGPCAPGSASPGGSAGWHYTVSIGTNAENVYTLAVPEGCVAREFSAALVWDRRIQTVLHSLWINPSPQLANLDLWLHASANAAPGAEITRSESGAPGSVAHPLEHVFARDLAAGEYALIVKNTAPSTYATDYGVAWFAQLEPAAPPDIASELSADGSALALAFSRLGIGLTYALQTSGNLSDWATTHTFTASAATATWTVSGTEVRAFYRLIWQE